MVAATIPTKSAVFLFSLFLFSCQNQISISENELINGLEIQKYIRTNEFSGTISVMYSNNDTLKSKRKYKKGKKMVNTKDGGLMVKKNIVLYLKMI